MLDHPRSQYSLSTNPCSSINNHVIWNYLIWPSDLTVSHAPNEIVKRRNPWIIKRVQRRRTKSQWQVDFGWCGCNLKSSHTRCSESLGDGADARPDGQRACRLPMVWRDGKLMRILVIATTTTATVVIWRFELWFGDYLLAYNNRFCFIEDYHLVSAII
jgi:hypothetical protein